MSPKLDWGGASEYSGRIKFIHAYDDIISVENLLCAWKEFVKGKRIKKDVQKFQLRLMDNIMDLHGDLIAKTYEHGGYHAFNISDPKPRNIHKASVRDRLLHHAIYRILYPFFDETFIADSFSCRLNKGTHKAIGRYDSFSCRVSRNHTKTGWILKCDVRKFFASIDQVILCDILSKSILDEDVIWLLKQVILSFHSTKEEVGLPLGNLTSQLLVNIYMNEFDQFVKHRLKVECYIRYADDFVIFSRERGWLLKILSQAERFLENRLKLQLHPDKISVRTMASGIDYLGWVHFCDHRVLRTATKKRMFKRLNASEYNREVTQSYLGMLSNGNGYKLQQYIYSSSL